MKKHVILLLCIIAFHPLYGQDENASAFQHKNSVQLDIGGHGLFYALNYERILLNGNRFKTASQVGISYYPAPTGIRDLWLPIGINELFSLGNHHIEAGLGYILIREAIRDAENNPEEWLWKVGLPKSFILWEELQWASVFNIPGFTRGSSSSCLNI